MAKPKQFTETSTLQVAMEAKIKKAFTLYCYNKNTTPSVVIREVVEKMLNEQ